MYKLLIVDDEHLIRNGLASINWQDVGFKVTFVAANGRDALTLIESDVPDTVLTDIKMPIMDGIQLMGILNDRYPQVKIIALSGYNDFSYAQKCIEYKVFSYILKPINEKELMNVFTRLREELDKRNKIHNLIRNGDTQFTPEERFFSNLISSSFSMASDKPLHPDEPTPVFKDYQCIVAFSWGDTKSSRDMNSILERSKQYWGKHRFPVLFLDHTFLVLIHGRTRLYPKDVRFYAERFKALMDDHGDGAVRIGLGNIYPLDKVGISYDEALYALRYHFFAVKDSIIAYSTISHMHNFTFNPATLKTVVEELAHHAIEGDGTDINNSTRELFWDILHKNCSDTKLLLLKCVEIYVSFVLVIEQVNKSVKVIPVDTFYYQLSECDSFEQLALIFKQYIMEIADQIKQLKSHSEHKLIARLKDYLRKNYHSNISLTEVSSLFFLNPSYLSTFFKKEAGINFSEYIIHLRIENAKHFIKNSDFSIQEISEKVGYSDYRYFCTIFKKITGDTPLKYRMKSIF